MEQMVEQCTGMMRAMGGMMNGGMMNGMMDGMMNGGMMNGMMGGMMLGTVVFIALLVVGAVLLVRFIGNRTDSGQGDALRILRERFARGEIDREEYQERRSTLQAQRS